MDRFRLIFFIFSMGITPFFSQADDLDLFIKEKDPHIRPNFLFIVDNSEKAGDPQWKDKRKKYGCIFGNCTRTVKGEKMSQIMKGELRELLDRSPNNINFGMMFHNKKKKDKKNKKKYRAWGGSVKTAVGPIELNKEQALGRLKQYASEVDGRPKAETLYESYLYLSGLERYYGRGYSTAESFIPDGRYLHYRSPITHSCQPNHIIFYGVGGTDRDSGANERIVRVLADTDFNGTKEPRPNKNDCRAGRSDCIDEIAWLLHNKDLSPLPGKQTARVHFVNVTLSGSGAARSIVEYGGGEYYGGGERHYGSLDVDIKRVVSDLVRDDQANSHQAITLSPPGRSSQLYQAPTTEDIYYALFEPSDGRRWSGNLKKYQLRADNKIYDAAGKLAIDPATGYFKDSAKSFWSSKADGRNIESGGMVAKLSKQRPIFVNMTGDSNTALGIDNNKLHANNSLITNALLSTRNRDESKKLLNWARDRKNIGDPIHTQPQPITYFKNASQSVVDKTIYFSTNDGFLHAVNDENGKTEFSFIPKDLLPNLKIYRDNRSLNGHNKPYGLDGPISVWVNDVNGDGDVLQASNGQPDPGEHVYIYLSMRRGGNNIYALDVTDRTNPTLKWVIRGDTDNNRQTDSHGDFAELGQTWSKPMLTTVQWMGRPTPVLFFGGGYDRAIDDQNTIQSSGIGNAVFMVHAQSGELLWKASHSSAANLKMPKLRYSIPANLTLVDTDNDQQTDLVFGADTGGQIFRIDIHQDNSGAINFASGGVIAKISDDNSMLGARRFFEPVSVSLGADDDILNLAIGSGLRHSPLSTGVKDRVYVIKTPSEAQNRQYFTSTEVITESSLYNATSNVLQEGDQQQKNEALLELSSRSGWFIEMKDSGEKILSATRSFNNILLFKSFVPGITDANVCDPAALKGTEYLYSLNIEDGSATTNFDTGTGTGTQATPGSQGSHPGARSRSPRSRSGAGSGSGTGSGLGTGTDNGGSGSGTNLNANDRRVALGGNPLAPPLSITTRNNGYDVCVGTECFDSILRGLDGSTIRKGYWQIR